MLALTHVWQRQEEYRVAMQRDKKNLVKILMTYYRLSREYKIPGSYRYFSVDLHWVPMKMIGCGNRV
jgi:hypothetical protein